MFTMPLRHQAHLLYIEVIMSYYAKVENNVVVRVIKAEQDYIDLIANRPEIGKWVKCSYNTSGGIHYDPTTGKPSADQSKALRKNYPAIGYKYDKIKDAFIPPKPYPSWKLNEVSCFGKLPQLCQQTVKNMVGMRNQSLG